MNTLNSKEAYMVMEKAAEDWSKWIEKVILLLCVSTSLLKLDDKYQFQECTLMVTSFSSIHSPPATQLYRIRKTDATVEGIVLNPIGWLHETKCRCIVYICKIN